MSEIDMLRSARDAQFEPLAFLGPGYQKVLAPAKVNLFLGVGECLDSGYHEVTTVMHAVSLHDVLYVNAQPMSSALNGESSGDPALVAGPNSNIEVSITLTDKVTPFGEPPLEIPTEKNLCFKAVDALAQAMRIEGPQRVTIHIEKNIPVQAGLGGGSSDAAATLMALARLWGVDPQDDVVIRTARSIGADVAFFFYGGCALLTGFGDEFVRTLEPSKQSLVLVKPDGGVSTAEAYGAFDADPIPIPATLNTEVDRATKAKEVPLFNNLAPASDSVLPALVSVRQWLADQPGILSDKDILLCGSGAAIFAFTESFADASRIAGHGKQLGLWARPSALSSLRAALV